MQGVGFITTPFLSRIRQENMELSKRLLRLTRMVTKGKKVADIGCDHAYVSIYLMKEKIASHVIAMDVNKGPLERAKANIRGYHLTDNIEVRLSDGAKELRPGEVDSILIAGMGGALMKRILSDSLPVVKELSELILQPQSELFVVRKYLHEIGFVIDQEDMLIEDGKYYTMLHAIKGEEKYSNDAEYIYGKQLLYHQNPVAKEFLLKEKRVKETIYQALQMGAVTTEKRKEELVNELNIIKEGLSYYDR